MEFLIFVDIFFNISPQAGNFHLKLISKPKSIKQLDFFCIIEQEILI